MDNGGNVKTSTLVIGAGGTLALLVLGVLVSEAFFPRLVYSSFIPASVFLLVFINVHVSKGKRAGR